MATYAPHVGARFELNHPFGPMHAKLVDVTDLRRRAQRRSHGEQFSLLFELPRSEPVAQGTYVLRHPAVGRFSLFLVPVGRGRKGVFLEAVVNRPRR